LLSPSSAAIASVVWPERYRRIMSWTSGAGGTVEAGRGPVARRSMPEATRRP
jgi:hypothetical protein